MQNKAKLVEKIAELIKEKKIEGVTDLRDESNRLGVRIILEVRQGFNASVIENQLYKFTPLQQSFGIIMLALVDGEPKVLNLKEMLYYYVEHQKDIIVRRTKFDLKKAEDRKHIVEGLQIALDNLDEVIRIIRAAKDVPQARNDLINAFNLSEIQAQAILDMRLQKLTGMERLKLEEELKELIKNIAYFRLILSDEKLVLKIIKEELTVIKEKHGDERRTEIVEDLGEIDILDLIVEEDVVITLTHTGYVKRMLLENYKSQKRGGRGIVGAKTQENDYVKQMHICSTHSNLLCFTNKGRVYQLKTYEIAEVRRQSRGTAMINMLPFHDGEFITTIMPVQEFVDDRFLLMVTAKGSIKKTPLKAFSKTRKSGLIALSLKEGDDLVSVMMTEGEEPVIIGSDTGHFILFRQEEVRSMGRTASGVKGINIPAKSRVIGADVIRPEHRHVLMVTTKGFGKRISLKELRSQKRGGRGVLVIKTNAERGVLSSFKLTGKKEEIMTGTAKGIIMRQKASAIPIQKRYSRGVTIMKVGEDDHVVILACIDSCID